MLRRITWLIPILALLTLSGCIIFPHAAGMTITTVTTRVALVITNIARTGLFALPACQ